MLSAKVVAPFAIPVLVSIAFYVHAQQNGSAPTPTISAPSNTIRALYGYRYSWIYESWVPDAARRKLEPIYQSQTEALLQLYVQASLEAQEMASDFLSAAYAASGKKSNADSPAGGENQSEGQIYQRNNQTLLKEIANGDSQIWAIRTEYGIDKTIGPPDSPFDAEALLSGEELAKAFLAVSSPDIFGQAFDEAQQSNASLDNSLRDLRARLNDVANHVISLKSEVGQLEASAAAAAAAQQSGGTMDTGIPIPPGWVPCTCTDRHPNAGLLINGKRYHSAALNCSQYY